MLRTEFRLTPKVSPFLLAAAVLLAGFSAHAQYGETTAKYSGFVSKKGVGIDQKLNSSIPLNLVFRDESDHAVPLRTYFGEKPVVLALVYYKCPGLCGLTLSDLAHSLKRVELEPARDYDVVIVSIDPKENPSIAAEKKQNYAKLFARPSFQAGWHFLTGDQNAITSLASAVGFHYRWDEPTHQFVHAAGVMIATPEGKLSRYFYGIQYTPTDLRLSLVEASRHTIGSPVDYVLLFCCPYDPMTGKYTVAIYNLLKLAGAGTLVLVLALIFLLNRSANKRRQLAFQEQQTAHR
ncbi:MAG: SCO family protein [Acidobacteriaceae bacterium]|nr:SCO family protein [Acidobacteriaceae bacterium]